MPEWYYLVCMSFQFNPGQGLPGRALANGQPIWLCHAYDADCKVFIRSLIAKSASIQTVVCFPFLGGVIELGVTKLVSEDPRLIQQVKTSCLAVPRPICAENSTSSPQNADEEDLVCAKFDHEIIDTMAIDKIKPVTEFETKIESAPQVFPLSPPPYMPEEEKEFNQDGFEELNANICEDLDAVCPDDNSNGCRVNQHTEDSFIPEDINGEASQVQSWQFMDDEFSNCMHNSINASDSISQTLVSRKKAVSSLKAEKINDQELKKCKHTKLSSLELGTHDLNYSRALSTIFKNSHRLIIPQYFHSGNHKCSFTSWEERGLVDPRKAQNGTPQKLLKKILFNVPGMHGGSLLKSREGNGSKGGLQKPEGEYVGINHVLSERRRREKLKEKFHVLRSLVPSVSKVDQASVLDDTIEYLKELERRVEELESCRELAEYEAREKRKHPDIVERTSANYGYNNIANGSRPTINKRKACDIDETDPEHNLVLSKDGLATYVTVSFYEKEVLIEMRCPWREFLLLEIMNAINNLNLDAHAVQSSTVDSILILTIKSKFRGVAVASAGVIKQVLRRVVGK